MVSRYEFDCDFLDLFEVKSQSSGERDLGPREDDHPAAHVTSARQQS